MGLVCHLVEKFHQQREVGFAKRFPSTGEAIDQPVRIDCNVLSEERRRYVLDSCEPGKIEVASILCRHAHVEC